MDDPFRTTIAIGRIDRSAKARELHGVMIDARHMFSWIERAVLEEVGILPARTDRFRAADGSVFEREVGFALLRISARQTSTLFVFAEPGDRVLVGAHALSGLNLRFDPITNQLVDAGPLPAAVAAA